MEKKQTAIEWLEKEFNKLEATVGVYGIMYSLIDQAKEMEKTQIINSYEFGVGDAYDYTSEEGELFYNEIYGK
jgi:hypothetical protein